MSGTDFCKLNRCLSTRLTPMGRLEHTLQTSPGKDDNLHSATAASTVWDSGSIGLPLVLESRPSQVSLICDFCSSVRNFAHRELFIPQSGFLQIPPRDGHPCLRLMLPTTKRIVDFHHQVIAHAGRTTEIPRQIHASVLPTPISPLRMLSVSRSFLFLCAYLFTLLPFLFLSFFSLFLRSFFMRLTSLVILMASFTGFILESL